MGFLPYNDRFKSYRRLFHQELGRNSGVREFFPQEEHLGRQFLRSVLNNPDDLLEHCFQYVHLKPAQNVGVLMTTSDTLAL